MYTNGINLTTCDGTFQFVGTNTSNTKRPTIRLDAPTNSGGGTNKYGSYMFSDDGVMLGSAAWAEAGGPYPTPINFKGPGTVSVENGVWGGTTMLSDYVFDKYYDHTVRPEDAPHAAGFTHVPVEQMTNYVERVHHLPTIEGREQWNEKGMSSVDHLTNQLWVTVEEQSLYIKELNERMNALQQYLVEKRLSELKKK